MPGSSSERSASSLAEMVPLRLLVTIAATVIITLMTVIITLTGTWSGTQTGRIGALEKQMNELVVGFEKLKTEKDQLRKSFDEDHLQVSHLVDFAGREDEILKNVVETMRVFKTAIDGFVVQQTAVRSALERIEIELQHARPSVMRAR